MFITYWYKMLFRNLLFNTHIQIGLSSDNRMANQFSKTFISHPVIFCFNLECYIMFVNICPAEKEMFASFIYFTQKQFVIDCQYLLGPLLMDTDHRITHQLSKKISHLGAKIIKVVDELDEQEGYVTRDLCIFMKEVGWNLNRTVMNGNSIYNGTRMSEGVLLYTFCAHGYYLGVQKGQQFIFRKIIFPY